MTHPHPDRFARARRVAAILAVLAVPAAHAIEYGDVTLTMPGQTREFKFLDYSYSNAGSNAAGNRDFVARLYVPENYDPQKKYGIVVMMHGDGEAGNQAGAVKNLTQVADRDNNGQVLQNIRNLTLNADTHDYLVLVPQSPGTYWGEEHMFMLKGLLARAATEYNVDATRISITGISKGGQGVFGAMMDHTGLYASYSPLTTVSYTGFQAARAATAPVWIFSGRQDSMLGSSRTIVSQIIQAQGGTAPSWPATSNPTDLSLTQGKLRYTEYASGGHNNVVWNSGAYRDQNYYAWMNAQKSAVRPLQTGERIAVNFHNPEENGLTYAVRDSAQSLWNSIDKAGMEKTLDYIIGFGQTTAGEQTDVHIAVTRAFQDHNTINTGTLLITAFGADAWIGRDYWRTAANDHAEITFFNLLANSTYDLKLFASIDAAGYTGLYSAGGVAEQFDASFNTAAFISLAGVTTDENGTLTLRVAPLGTSGRAVLNAFELTAVPEPSAAGLAVAALAAGVAGRRRKA